MDSLRSSAIQAKDHCKCSLLAVIDALYMPAGNILATLLHNEDQADARQARLAVRSPFLDRPTITDAQTINGHGPATVIASPYERNTSCPKS